MSRLKLTDAGQEAFDRLEVQPEKIRPQLVQFFDWDDVGVAVVHVVELGLRRIVVRETEHLGSVPLAVVLENGGDQVAFADFVQDVRVSIFLFAIVFGHFFDEDVEFCRFGPYDLEPESGRVHHCRDVHLELRVGLAWKKIQFLIVTVNFTNY
jgi:hypothetical protein